MNPGWQARVDAIKDTLPRAMRLRYGVAAERLPEGPLREAYVGPVQLDAQVGLYPIVTSQYSSTTLFQVSYHTR